MKTENQTPQDEVLMGATCMEFDRRLLYALVIRRRLDRGWSVEKSLITPKLNLCAY